MAREKFLEMESKNSDSDLQRNEKYMYFKDQLKEMKKQCKSDFLKTILWMLNGKIWLTALKYRTAT